MKSITRMTGWALYEYGIQEVELSVDDDLCATVTKSAWSITKGKVLQKNQWFVILSLAKIALQQRTAAEYSAAVNEASKMNTSYDTFIHGKSKQEYADHLNHKLKGLGLDGEQAYVMRFP